MSQERSTSSKWGGVQQSDPQVSRVGRSISAHDSLAERGERPGWESGRERKSPGSFGHLPRHSISLVSYRLLEGLVFLRWGLFKCHCIPKSNEIVPFFSWKLPLQSGASYRFHVLGSFDPKKQTFIIGQGILYKPLKETSPTLYFNTYCVKSKHSSHLTPSRDLLVFTTKACKQHLLDFQSELDAALLLAPNSRDGGADTGSHEMWTIVARRTGV